MMVKKIFCRTALMAMLGLLGLLCVAGTARAECRVSVSMSNVQLGNLSVASLRASDVAGYRSMGTKNQIVSVTCDVAQAAFRLELGNLAAVIGKPLLRWGEAGAMQLRAQGASVAGIPVNMKLERAVANGYAPAVDVTQNDMIVLDLSHVPDKDRKSFSLQLQLTGLLPDNYLLRSQVKFESNVSVRLVGEK